MKGDATLSIAIVVSLIRSPLKEKRQRTADLFSERLNEALGSAARTAFATTAPR